MFKKQTWTSSSHKNKLEAVENKIKHTHYATHTLNRSSKRRKTFTTSVYKQQQLVKRNGWQLELFSSSSQPDQRCCVFWGEVVIFYLVSDFISHFRLVGIAEPTIAAYVATLKKCGNRLPDSNLNWKKLWIKEITFYQNSGDVKGRVSLSEIERESECATNPTMDLIRSQEKECLSGNKI